MDVLSESVTARLARLVRAKLVADTAVGKIFGSSVFDTDWDQFEHAIRPPQLAIVPKAEDEQRTDGNEARFDGTFVIEALLPMGTPGYPDLTIPASPVISVPGDPGSGALTGDYTYRLTALYGPWYACRESYASPEISVTLDRQTPRLGLPSTGNPSGYRIWRGEAGRAACRSCETILNGQACFDDTVLDADLGDELAPARYWAKDLRDHLAQVCYLNETLEEGVTPTADAALRVKALPDQPIRSRNLRAVGIEATFRTLIDVETRQILVGTSS